MAGKVGFIGLGAMGGPMALNLAKAGHKLVVHDIDQSKTAAVRAKGAELAGNAEAVAAAVERTILIVETTEQAESVITGEHGIIQGAKPGHIVVCMSTIDPFAAREIADRLAAQGHRHGRRAGERRHRARAQSGELSVIVGGDAEVSPSARTCSSAMGNRTFHVGAAGQRARHEAGQQHAGPGQHRGGGRGPGAGRQGGARSADDLRGGARLDRRQRAPGSCACRASSRATTSRAARSTSPTRTRSSRPPSPSAWACRCCSRTSRSRSTRWRRAQGLNKQDGSAIVKIFEQMAGVTVKGD